MTIKTKFELNQTVKIIPLENCPGRVMNFWVTDHVEYKVRYFIDGDLKEVYFLESELKEVNQ